jgi:2-C-methyl-D-erythritol 4-phosphate cytidylyltransferase/2-C-methyl-D-erythritol 2,4-cyclodiphosphate synthase
MPDPRPVAGVLVAAGASRRMGADKVWLELWGRPAWRWSLDAMLAVPGMTRVALVTPADALDRFRGMLPPASLDRCLLVAGGAERVDSVTAGISALTAAGTPDGSAVLVHDAARPAASTALMTRVADAVEAGHGVLPVVPLHDSIKRLDATGRVVAAIDRESLVAAQTPQAATLGALRAALEEAQAWGRTVTDEAAALAAGGVPVISVPGEAGNLKLTEPGDELRLAAVLAASAAPLAPPALSPGQRAGVGFDAHRRDPGRALRLGGLAWPGEAGLAGHSDGDVALHAVIDALLGAVGAGDIGSRFPSGDERWRDADSGEMLSAVVRSLAGAGWRPIGIDLAVVAAAPPIAPRREEMATRIAALCGLPPMAVSVKGTTSDGLGFAGGEGIAAHALAVVAPRDAA